MFPKFYKKYEHSISISCASGGLGGYDKGIKRALTSEDGITRPRDTRRQLLEAADRAVRARGLMGASTREIAREAGVADGTLYVHFSDRIDLFIALIQEHLPPYVEPLKRLNGLVGRRTVRANLAEVFEGALIWNEQMVPVFGAISADRDLCVALQQRLAERNEGPHLAIKALERYLEAEQKLGRVNKQSDPKAAAMMLLGAAQYWTSIAPWVGTHLNFSRQQLTKEVLKLLMMGLEAKPAVATRPARSRR